MNNSSNFKKQKGAALLIVVFFFVVISLIVLFSVSGPAIRQHSISNNSIKSKQSYFFAESGVEDVVYRIKNNLSVSSSETLTLNGLTTTTNINTSAFQKEVLGLAQNSDVFRAITTVLVPGTGASFNYGIQSGQGGVTFSNNSGINGNIYTNGTIVGASGAFITGTAVAANGDSATADQSYGISLSSNVNTSFRNAASTQDAAQSFVLSATNPLLKANVYIRKVVAPSNATVTIRTDNSGNPSSTVLATGTLNSALVTTSYGWVNISFSSTPNLSSGVTYWLVIDNSTTSSSNYYQWGGSSSYGSGLAKVGTVGGTWYIFSPQITSGTDFFFEIYTGGAVGSISNIIVGTGTTGDAWANTVTSSTIRGALYCQTGSSNNKSCNTSRPDPGPQDFPISDANITEWKDAAVAGGTVTGNVTISSNSSYGPKKIVGNLTVSNGATLTLDGTVWVTGNITLSNNSQIKLSSSYGSLGGIIIADGTISLSNNSTINGSGFSGSYTIAISMSSSGSAISLSNNGGGVILYAPNGTISLSNNAGAKQVTGYRISLSNNAVITYDSGLASTVFSTGPAGGWNLSSWDETE